MRSFAAVALALALSGIAFPQHRGAASPAPRMVVPRAIVSPGPVAAYRTYGSPSGFGNINFPGTGTPPTVINPFRLAPTFVERYGRNLVGSTWGYGGYGGAGYAPLAWPVVVGGFDSSAADYLQAQQAQQPPNITIVMPPQQGNVPPVTINQNFGPGGAQPQGDTSGIQYYQAPSGQSDAAQAAPADNQVLFFIALKDSSVYTAVAYWVQDGILNYVTPQGRHNQVSLDLVDRQVSERLNADRKLDFRLPAR